MNDRPGSSARASSGLRQFRKIGVLVTVIVAAGLFHYFFGDQLSLESLAAQEASLRVWQRERPTLLMGAAFLLYVIVTAASLPGAAVLTLAYGWFFGKVDGEATIGGLLRAVLLVSFASTTGATLAFLLSRYLFQQTVERRFGERLQKVNAELKRDGAFYLFTLRLIVALPFWLINLLMGLTPIRLRTFWWVSQLGMLPATVVYVFAGQQIPTAEQLANQSLSGILDWKIVLAFVLLGSFPLLVRQVMRAIGRRSTA